MANLMLLLGRILMSVLFILAGLGKLTAATATQEMLAKLGMPVPMLGWLVSVVIELGGGLALLFGLATRPVAAALSVWCIITALVAHTNFADYSTQIQFMKNLAMSGGFIYVAVFGAGTLSIDGWRTRRSVG